MPELVRLRRIGLASTTPSPVAPPPSSSAANVNAIPDTASPSTDADCPKNSNRNDRSRNGANRPFTGIPAE